jgi:glycosyltransferase involved in cell wall biosynthesis
LTAHRPTLSVIMPNYNHGRYVAEALEAILRQTYRPMELVVLDDGSTDDSVQVIEQFTRRDSRVRLLRNEYNRGIFFAIQRLLRATSGEYVCTAAADDKVLPGFFEKSMGMLARYPQAGLCCTDPAWLDPEVGTLSESRFGWSDNPCYLSPDELAAQIRGGAIWGHTCILKRSALINAGGFIPQLCWHCDWFANLVIGFRHGICYVPEPLAAMRLMTNSYCAAGMRKGSLQRSVLNRVLTLLTSPAYADVSPYFVRGQNLDRFGRPLLIVALANPSHWNARTLRLIEAQLKHEYWMARYLASSRVREFVRRFSRALRRRPNPA